MGLCLQAMELGSPESGLPSPSRFPLPFHPPLLLRQNDSCNGSCSWGLKEGTGWETWGVEEERWEGGEGVNGVEGVEGVAGRVGQHSELNCKVFTFIIYVGIFGAMVIVGVLGNSLSFVVLSMDRQSHAATFLLQTMSVIDNSFLITTGFTQILPAYALYVHERDHHLMAYVQAYVHPLVHGTQLATVWITVLIAFNRFIAICRPFRAPMLCTMTRVRIQVLLMLMFVFVYNVPRFYETCVIFKLDPFTNITMPLPEQSTLARSSTYSVVYGNVLYCLVVFLGPLVILVLLNTCIIRELLNARRRLSNTRPTPRSLRHNGRSARGGAGGGAVGVGPGGGARGAVGEQEGGKAGMGGEVKGGCGRGRRELNGQITKERKNSSDDQEQNITLVMIVIVIVYLVCQTPAYLNQLLYYVLGEEEYHCEKAYFYYYHISNLIVSANSAVNFFVYCVFRKQFRQRLVVLCARCGGLPGVRCGRGAAGSMEGVERWCCGGERDDDWELSTSSRHHRRRETTTTSDASPSLRRSLVPITSRDAHASHNSKISRDSRLSRDSNIPRTADVAMTPMTSQ